MPNTITGPAIRNILAAMPVTNPSLRKSMAGDGHQRPGAAKAGQLVVQVQPCQQGGEKHQRAGGGGARRLFLQAGGSPAVQDQLAHHADGPAHYKGQDRILQQRRLGGLLLHILLVFLRRHIH